MHRYVVLVINLVCKKNAYIYMQLFVVLVYTITSLQELTAINMIIVIYVVNIVGNFGSLRVCSI